MAGTLVGLEFTESRGRRFAREAVDLVRALVTQSLIQAFMATSGILIVRALGTQDYAYYTIGAAAITAVAALSNGGILEGMTAIGARAPFDTGHMTALIRTALSLRRRCTIYLVVPIAVSSIWMLTLNGAPATTIAPLVLAIVLVNIGELNCSVLQIVPWLQRRIDELQAIELLGAITRFAGCAIVPFLVPRADVAVLCAAVAFGLQVHLLRRRGLVPKIDRRVPPDPALRVEIAGVLRRQWLNDLNALAQGQLSLWLLTAFAGAGDVAAFGALGRITIVFTIILQALHRTMLSRYARLQNRESATRIYLAVIVAFVLISALPLALIVLWPNAVLAVFGAKYAGFTLELQLFCVNTLLGSLATLTLWLNSVRAWIMPATFRILYQTSFMLAFVVAFGATTLHGIILAGIGVNLLLIVANIAYSVARFRGMADHLSAPVIPPGRGELAA